MLPSRHVDLTQDDSDDDAAASDHTQARALGGGAWSRKRSRPEKIDAPPWRCCGMLNDSLANECALCNARRPDGASLPSPADATSRQSQSSSRPSAPSAQADADDDECQIVGFTRADTAVAMTGVAQTSAEPICIPSGVATRHDAVFQTFSTADASEGADCPTTACTCGQTMSRSRSDNHPMTLGSSNARPARCRPRCRFELFLRKHALTPLTI